MSQQASNIVAGRRSARRERELVIEQLSAQAKALYEAQFAIQAALQAMRNPDAEAGGVTQALGMVKAFACQNRMNDLSEEAQRISTRLVSIARAEACFFGHKSEAAAIAAVTEFWENRANENAE